MSNRNAARHTTKQDVYVGDRIREARITAGMSQKELGELIGVSYQQMQKYETGKNRINGARIELLISALNRPFNYFFPGATDVRAPADPAMTWAVTSKDGQAIVRASYRVTSPKRRRVLLDVALALAEEAS